MFKVHQLHQPRMESEPEVQARLIWDFEILCETTFWGAAATRLLLSNGERIYVAESADALTNLWLGFD